MRPLPTPLRAAARHWMDAQARAWLRPAGGPVLDFTQPPGEAALAGPGSVSWRVFKNPVATFVGGVAAVVLELAEPRVCRGVWDHSTFRTDPAQRLQRTGLAAMVTVYGAQSVAERMIAGIVRRHEGVRGHTGAGVAYRANDPELLRWVQATAAYGFVEAYSRYVAPLTGAEFDRFHAEGRPAARLYGAAGTPTDRAGVDGLIEGMRGTLEASPAVFEFLRIMGTVPVLPGPLRPVQRMLVRAGVELVPGWVRGAVGLGKAHGLKRWEEALVRAMGGAADQVALPSHPAVQACLRLGLAGDALYRG